MTLYHHSLPEDGKMEGSCGSLASGVRCELTDSFPGLPSSAGPRPGERETESPLQVAGGQEPG